MYTTWPVDQEELAATFDTYDEALEHVLADDLARLAAGLSPRTWELYSDNEHHTLPGFELVETPGGE